MSEDAQDRKDIEARLRASEERFRLAQEAGGIGTFQWDLLADEWEWTHQTAILFGFDPEEARPRFGDWERAIFVDDVPKLRAAAEAASRTGAFYVEFRVRRRDRAVRWLAGKGEPARDESDRARWLRGVLFDITQRKELEARLLALNETLEARVAERSRQLEAEHQAREEVEAALRHAQKIEALGQLTGGVAHDFNNLLAALIGNLELALRSADAKTARLIENALRSAERGAKLTEQLLAFARRQQRAPGVADLNGLVRGASDLIARAVGANVAVDMALADDLWATVVDGNQLELAVLNLAINARDAMPGGGVLRIETANRRRGEALPPDLPAGDYVRLSIADSGTGMPPDVASRAFEPFFTTKEVGKGSGLGLSMVHGVAKHAGGTATLETQPGKGTTVRLYLPRARAERAAAPDPAAAQPRPEWRAAAGRVLVVDDDDDVRTFLVECLQNFGYEVVSAADGEEALAILARERFDAAVVDLVMPAMDGVAFAERASAADPALRIVIVTGYASTERVEKAEARWPVLRKPLRLTDLARALGEAAHT